MQNYKFIEKQLVDVALYRPNWVNGSKYKYPSIILWFSMSFILTGIPLFNLTTVPELAKGCFGLLGAVIMLGVSTSLMSQSQNIYIFIDRVNEIIQKREFQESI